MESVKTILLLTVLLSLNFISASTCDINTFPCNENVNFNNPITSTVSTTNYSTVNTNDSQYLRGLTPQQVANLFDASSYYLKSNPSNFYNSSSLPATNINGTNINVLTINSTNHTINGDLIFSAGATRKIQMGAPVGLGDQLQILTANGANNGAGGGVLWTELGDAGATGTSPVGGTGGGAVNYMGDGGSTGAAGMFNVGGSGGQFMAQTGAGGDVLHHGSAVSNAGNGGQITLTSGRGGSAASCTGGTGVPGAGGNFVMTAGLGGQAYPGATGGIGGALSFTGGSGGTSYVSNAGTNTGGLGGNGVFTAGGGGQTQNGATNNGGKGGNFVFTGGLGGMSTKGATGGTSGNGGDLRFVSGDAGAVQSGATMGNAGNIYFASGAASSGTLGNIFLGYTSSGVARGNVNISGDFYSHDKAFYFNTTNNQTDLQDINLNSNSKKLYMGLTKQSSISYNGSDLLINPKETGAGKVYLQGQVDAQNNYSVNGVQGLTKNITIVKSVDLIALTKVMCDMNFTGGILTSSNC